MNLFTKEIGLEIRFKAMGCMLEVMVIGLTIKCKGQALIFGLMAISIQAIMTIIKNITVEFITIFNEVSQMGLNMKDNGQTESNMAL